MGLKQTALAIGIAIVFTVFIAYGLWAVYEPPKRYYEQSDCFEQFDCDKELRECWEKERPVNETIPRPIDEWEIDKCSREFQTTPEYQECDEKRDECEDAFRKTTDSYKHARNSFYVLFIIALAAIVAGMFLRLESISSGFITGGVLILLWSLIYTAEYWLQWNKYVKLTALGIVLVILVYLGYKKIESKVAHKQKTRKKR
ncbi:hypothetical protein KY349_05800 [Candidatus Woesearchaeota archaeon]|nr:hypothetical protein [Candidatus Woesearchaeota archaeon]